jgi:GAF domain-containing protein
MAQQKQQTSYDKQLLALGRTLQTLREEENVEVLIETVLSFLEAEFDYILVWIGLYDRLDHRLLGKGGRVPDGVDLPLLRQRFPLTPGDILEQVVIQQRPLRLPDLRDETRAGEWRKVAQQFGVQGTLVFPMRYKDRCFGVALLGSKLWGISPKPQEKARLSIILGELAASLYQLETDWQRQQTKHLEEPLLALLPQLRALKTLDKCLEAVVEETHRFVEPTRTNIYWFEPSRRYFWRRVSNHQKAPSIDGSQPASGIMVSELGGFYQALLADQVVSIGEAQSSLKAEVTTRLIQQIRARSLLAAPISFQKEILGFLAVEGNEPRIWREEEKNYVRGAAQLLSLVAPVAQMESTIEQVKLDQFLTAGIAKAIYRETDWFETLKNCGEKLLERLKVERFVVLVHNTQHHQFDICYQNHPSNRRSLPSPMVTLPNVDTQMLLEAKEAVAIENWTDDDLRLHLWRPVLFDLGVRSLLVSATSTGTSLQGAILVACETARSWSTRERELVYTVAQQMGLILHQWQLQANQEQSNRLLTMLQTNLGSLQQTHLTADKMERLVAQQLMEFTRTPLVGLVTWQPGHPLGRIVIPAASDPQFTLTTDIEVPVQTDALIQWTILQTEGPLSVSVTDLPLETKEWMNAPGIGQILAMALRTSPTHQPTGILFLVDRLERRWSEETLKAVTLLTNQLAWSRRYVMLTTHLQQVKDNLECLNWYKHRRFEDFYRGMKSGLRKLTELSNHKGTFGSLQIMRLRQIVRQLKMLVQSVRNLLKQEQWQLVTQSEIVPLASLLRRTLDRLSPIVHQRQLWTQVHTDNHLNLYADPVKLEWVLYEVLVTACRRSNKGSRIDIWCRPMDDKHIDLSITDTGSITPSLLADLQTEDRSDILVPSSLDEFPGLNLSMAIRIIKKMGGQLNFYQLEDGRITSQLILPILNAK